MKWPRARSGAPRSLGDLSSDQIRRHAAELLLSGRDGDNIPEVRECLRVLDNRLREDDPPAAIVPVRRP